MDQPSKRPGIFNPRRKDITKRYSNGEVTVVWKPRLCIHSGICYSGLPEVFDPGRRPWIAPEAAATDQIVALVKECPSGALSYVMNNDGQKEPLTEEKPVPETFSEHTPGISIEVLPNGPLLVRGDITIRDSQGNEVTKGPVTAFCRCGATRNKPFCDGAHVRIGFKG
jgi:uncharacterized Fe-S cluster protein YjdI